MMDLILAWARLDAGIGQLAALGFGMDLSVGAVIFGKMSVTDRLLRLRELNKQLGRSQNQQALKTLKVQYEQHSKLRNIIAHSTLAGRYIDGRLVFLPFHSTGNFGELAVDLIATTEIDRSVRWAKRLNSNIDAMIEEQMRSMDQAHMQIKT